MKASDVKSVAVVGAGLMGHGIAQAFALGGFEVRFNDLTPERLQRGLDGIRANMDVFVQNDLASAPQAQRALRRIRGTTELAEALQGVDFVVEAVFEDLGVKQQVFAQCEALCPSHTVLASNTSGLSVNEIARAAQAPERVIVAHFWNPPHLMTLVEVVPGRHTAPATVQLTCDVLRRCGKRPIVLQRDVPGHIGNRLQYALLREALYIVQQGIASAEDVDAVVELTIGRRLAVTGPLKSADLGGLDVFEAICSYLFGDLDNATEPSGILTEPVSRGDYGAKTGKGIYEWPPERLRETLAAREAELIRWLKAEGG